MIEIKGLSKSFGSKQVLKEIDARFVSGRVTGIVGPNACGKSTFMKCLLSLVLPTSGEVLIDGARTDPRGDFRRKIGFMPQTPVFPKHLCLDELLTMLEKLRGEPAATRRELLQYFELNSFLHQPIQQLSGGTQQKISAVIAFMFNAPIIILDEPTVGLDPVTAVHFKDLVVQRARQGALILFVSHIMSEVEQLADELAFMNDGRIAFFGSVQDLYRKTDTENLERAIVRLLETKRSETPC